MSNNTYSNGVNSLLGRVSNFFHIFDLPFFVSGFTTLSAFGFLATRFEKFSSYNFAYPSWVGVIAVIITSYVLGLISFTIGRGLNSLIFRKKSKLKEKLDKAIENHGLQDNDIINSYYETKNRWYLYIRLWQDLVEYKPDSLARKHLSRYWALAALYDALSMSLITWFIVIIVSICGVDIKLSPLFGSFTALAFFITSIFTLKQGGKYYEYQIDDLVAHIAAKKSKI